MSLWGALWLAFAFVVLLGVVALARRRPGATAEDATPAEALSLFMGHWWLLHWLPHRFDAAGAGLGLALGALSWALLMPRAGWASGLAVLTIVAGGEYCGEAVWQGLAKRRWGRFLVAGVGSLLCLSAMGLHFGLAIGGQLPFPFPELP